MEPNFRRLPLTRGPQLGAPEHARWLARVVLLARRRSRTWRPKQAKPGRGQLTRLNPAQPNVRPTQTLRTSPLPVALVSQLVATKRPRGSIMRLIFVVFALKRANLSPSRSLFCSTPSMATGLAGPNSKPLEQLSTTGDDSDTIRAPDRGQIATPSAVDTSRRA